MEKTYVQTLTGLGLTSCQGRVYLELVRMGPSSAKAVSASAQVTRQDVYRIMPTLQKLGLVETVIGSPTLFSAIPIEEGVSILMKRRKREHYQLRVKTQDLLENFKNVEEKKRKEEDFAFVLIPPREADVKHRKRSLSKTKETFDSITSKRRFSQAVFHMFDTLNVVAKRGVKIRLITEEPEKGELPKELENLAKTSNLEIRYLSQPPKAVVNIVDKKEASILTLETAGWAQSPSFWTNNPSFVAVVQDHFDATWNKAVPVS
ncbi:MAG: hypothetical protein NWF00_11825 [Candidatus Bathyarchaeota archaeon]|nr:hypothetical protein [Candidatus Bathyarchaeota archaeon]